MRAPRCSSLTPWALLVGGIVLLRAGCADHHAVPVDAGSEDDVRTDADADADREAPPDADDDRGRDAEVDAEADPDGEDHTWVLQWRDDSAVRVVEALADGDVLAAGELDGMPLLARLRPSGSEAWTRFFGRYPGRINEIEVTSEGRVFVVGWRTARSSSALALPCGGWSWPGSLPRRVSSGGVGSWTRGGSTATWPQRPTA